MSNVEAVAGGFAPALIVPRRSFLIRALGFTVAGATVPISIVKADAEARISHHEAELKKAWQDYFGPIHDMRGFADRSPVGTIETSGSSYKTGVFMICAGGGKL